MSAIGDNPNADGDYLTYSASQTIINQVLIPCTIGWNLQLFLSGVATVLAIQHLIDHPQITWQRRLLVISMTVLNLWATSLNVVENVQYSTQFDRSTNALFGFSFADALVFLPEGLTATAAQVFFGHRAWKFMARSYTFAAVLIFAISAGLTTSIGLTVINFKYKNGTADYYLLFAWTEAWLFAYAGTDVIISATLCYRLFKLRNFGMANQSMDTMRIFNAIIRITLTTALLPATCAVIAAIIYVATWKGSIWNLFISVSSLLPSLHLISCVINLNLTTTSGSTIHSENIFDRQRQPPQLSKSHLHQDSNRSKRQRGTNTHLDIETNIDEEKEYAFSELVEQPTSITRKRPSQVQVIEHSNNTEEGLTMSPSWLTGINIQREVTST